MTNENTTSSRYIPILFQIGKEDSIWIVSSSFIIFTMQTGFGMLESGCVSIKNEVNIMMKNVVDISLGGITYWAFGFGMSFGFDKPTNSFIGTSGYLIDPYIYDDLMGPICAAFLFQLSFCTTSTTIVSGALAERCNFKAYCLFSSLNTIVYCIPAGWMWGDHGFLKHLGAVDIAGSGVVHVVGGFSALACAVMLGPRLGRYDNGFDPLPLGNPVNAILGLFVLWWGWLAFNSGSTYGVNEDKWKFAARAAVSTVMASMGGGIVGLSFSLTNPHAWEAVVVGMIGGFITCFTMPIIDKFKIDDPVGAFATHGASGIWGLLSIGFFADNPGAINTTSGRSGLFKGGGYYLLGIQSLAVLTLTVWAFTSSVMLLWFVNLIIPIRMAEHEELIGADLFEHGVRHKTIGVSRAISALQPFPKDKALQEVPVVGINTGHESYIKEYIKAKKLNNLFKLKNRQKIKQKNLINSSNQVSPQATIRTISQSNWLD
ncbi:putative ammonium transporter 3 isoform X2 [Aphidius gifuensis]|uniref:putative ammonium transporter 3 isoform X2 n=1 Tax=Aphidius gifuensis TaxID=684658 RepID=UPI001CDC2082|nr:putative ammonium transporter 3 isoform X2 [Aphidius gifuensis]